MVLCILQEEIAAHLCSALVYDTFYPCFRATSGVDLFGVFNLIMAIYIDFFAVLMVCVPLVGERISHISRLRSGYATAVVCVSLAWKQRRWVAWVRQCFIDAVTYQSQYLLWSFYVSRSRTDSYISLASRFMPQIDAHASLYLAGKSMPQMEAHGSTCLAGRSMPQTDVDL